MILTRILALVSLVAVIVVASKIVFAFTGSGTHAHRTSTNKATGATGKQTSTTGATGTPGTAPVPILAYHVINTRPAGSNVDPRFYVSANQFSAQMQALKTAGWHPVTLNQLEAYWTRGVPLATSKPIVITFDNGYASQYTNALPVLKQLGWVAVENLQVNGLRPADGGLSESQVRGLIAAGWELDAAGLSQPDLTILGPTQLHTEVANARQELQSRYSVPVNWFSYPSGDYNPSVTAAVQAAGFVGSTTLVRGWASPKGNRLRLPRLQVAGGTSTSALLSQIASAEKSTTAPASSHA